MAMIDDIERVLITEQELAQRVRELGAQISRDYADADLFLISVLKGSIVFMADLMRHISIPHSIDFMATSSYGASTQSSGVVQILKDLEESIEGRHVLIVEDIIDSGHTLAYLRRLILARNPASLRICALLDKKERRESDVPVEYVGFSIPNEFVVGYGLDFNEQYRNLPFVGVLKAECYRTA
jgi:hypoxanthine phosphoribosyltransferase